MMPDKPSPQAHRIIVRRRCPFRVGGVGLLLMAAPLWAQEPPPKVRVTEVVEREVPITITLVGTVVPRLRSVLGSEIEGLVAKIDVRAGDNVEAGQVLCELKVDTLEIQKQGAIAERDRLRAKLQELEEGTRKAELERLRAAVEEARALYQMWDFEKRRLEKLYSESQGTEKELRDAGANALAAAHRLTQETAAYQLAEEGPRKEEIAQARFAVSAQEAVLARIENDIERSRIRAPYAASIVKRFVEVGEWVERGGNVVEIVSLEDALVVVQVPESSIAYAKVGETARATVDALKKTVTGRITHVIAEADEAARTFPVELVVPNRDRQLKAGMFVRATLRGGPRQRFTVVPKDAVVHREGFNYVSVIEVHDGKTMAFPTPVKLGGESGDHIAVISDAIRPGMRVVTVGNERLLFPTRVEVSAEPSLAGPETQPAVSRSE